MISNNFYDAVNYVISNEGLLSNNPHDLGGITKYGISFRFIKSFSVEKQKKYGIYPLNDESIINLTIPQAKDIYKGEFWDHANFSDIDNQDCCNFIFDMAINMGISPAIKCAQRACWSIMNKRGIIEDDGILGSETISLINQCGKNLIFPLRSERAGYYRLISEKNSSQEFINGWLNRAYGK